MRCQQQGALLELLQRLEQLQSYSNEELLKRSHHEKDHGSGQCLQATTARIYLLYPKARNVPNSSSLFVNDVTSSSRLNIESRILPMAVLEPTPITTALGS
ncbi:hypothetical protein Nepgr_022568 [Nepenthes gracilis]|uniref:Uncharacterized protein n=1 Tax=Nepenthes gracilis TaxID=150966 RepID=A0AAD3T135_NEPGR|nr:hypothetical protein Nepgr_022568 [Nepenthes gracilis]